MRVIGTALGLWPRLWVALLAAGGGSGGLAADRMAGEYAQEAQVFQVGGSSIDGRVPDLAVSPDGRSIAFQVRKFLPAEGRYEFDLWIAASDGHVAPRQLTHRPAVAQSVWSLTPRWSPDGKSLVYVDSDGTDATLRIISPLSPEKSLDGPKIFGRGPRGSTWYGDDLAWRPDGKVVAFIAPAVNGSQGRELHPEEGIEFAVYGWSPENGACERLTPEGISAQSFSWSPDGTQLAISGSAARKTTNASVSTDVYLVDLASLRLAPLVVQPGIDRNPAWSPDGRWIAFLSQAGKENWRYETGLAVFSRASGEVRYLSATHLHDIGSVRGFRWGADSSTIFFESFVRMENHLFRTSREGSEARQLTGGDLAWCTNFSLSTTGQLAFTREGPLEPPEIFTSDLEGHGLRQVTHLNLPAGPNVEVRRTTWRSFDDRFMIDALLYQPAVRGQGGPWPLLVYLEGGPSMVRGTFEQAMHYSARFLAEQGYLVLVPNTRGRPGGYGAAFASAIADEQSYTEHPFADLMGGVDQLVAQGLVDPERIGIFGHSYGAYLAAYALTRTPRFHAALMFEAHTTDRLGDALRVESTPETIALRRDLLGSVGAPYEPAVRDQLMRESPLFQVKNVVTPTLLEVGGQMKADRSRPFYFGLRYYGVPSDYIVHDREWHTIADPATAVRSRLLALDWFDYWLRDRRDPDPAEREQYDRWDQLRERWRHASTR